MVMRSSDPRQRQVPPVVRIWLAVVLGPIAILLVVQIVRVVLELLRLAFS